MKLYLKNKIFIFCLAFIIGMFTFSASAEGIIEITPGTPLRDGTSTWTIYLQGQAVDIQIQVKKTDTAEDKARKIAIALDNLHRQRGLPSMLDGTVTNPNGTITISLTSNVQRVLRHSDTTGERDTIVASASPQKGTFDIHLITGSVLAGVDQDGLESQFQASFGFNGIMANANFNFSDLSGNTIDALLTDTYNSLLSDLPATYRSMLSINLSSSEINFEFPFDAINGFVENMATDINTSASLGLALEIPEPSTPILLATGLMVFSLTKKIVLCEF